MTSSHQLVVSHKQLLLVAVSAFGGMVTAMVATLAIVMPMMSAQATSLLDRQAEQLASLQQASQPSKYSRAATTAGAVTADVSSDFGVCVEPPQENGDVGGQGAEFEVSSFEFGNGGEGEGFIPHEIPAPVVRELSTINNTTNNTVNDSHDTSYAINSNNNGSYNQDSFNKTQTNVAVEASAKKQGNVNVTVGSYNDKTNVANDSYNATVEQTKTVVNDSFNSAETTSIQENHTMSQPTHEPTDDPSKGEEVNELET